MKEVEQLRAALTANDADYVLLSSLPDSVAHARFIGRFEGNEVVWDMHLYTLERHEQERGRVPIAPDFRLRGLMIIEPLSTETCRLEVALKVPVIDETVIRKAIVMMRNYRRLHVGLRTWGDDMPGETI